MTDFYEQRIIPKALPSDRTVDTVRCVTCIASGSLFWDCVRPINILREYLLRESPFDRICVRLKSLLF
jgi:hypothetical protein